MKRFHFSLQALLTLRQRAEQKALEKYASALLARQRALERADAVRHEQNEWWARRRQELAKGCSAGSLDQWCASNHNLNEQRKAAENGVAQAEVSTNQALQSMLLARRDREAVEKHLHRERERYQRALGQEEQKILDDMANRRVFTLSSTRGQVPSYD